MSGSVLVDGTVDLMSTKDSSSKETITSTHHDSPRFIHADGKKGQRIQPGPFINHTDVELLLIEELVGRALPFIPGDDYDGPRCGYWLQYLIFIFQEGDLYIV